jgi:hypothetical protein
MTDVPFVSLSIIGIWFAIRFFERRKSTDYFLFVLFSFLTIFCRQVGIIVPIAFALMWLFENKKTFKNFLSAVFPVLLLLILLKTFKFYLLETNNLPANYNLKLGILQKIISNPDIKDFKRMVFYIVTSFTEIGFFLLPIIIAMYNILCKK